MSRMSEKSGHFDVVIIGAGPAGMAAALWCDELKLSACLIEIRTFSGGQLDWIHNPINNYPGTAFRDGRDCLDHFKRSLADRSFSFRPNESVAEINVESGTVGIGGDDPIRARAIILATGVRRRQLGVPGENDFIGRGLLASGSRDRHDASGATVAVIGGGDAALENAIILGERAEKVYLIHRRDRFSARAEFVRAVNENQRIESVMSAEVREFGGSESLEFIDIERGMNGPLRIRISKAVVRVGVVPNSELLVGKVVLDNAGYVTVDRSGRTSTPNVYAVGDVAFPESPTIATAVGSAAAAVKSIAANIRVLE